MKLKVVLGWFFTWIRRLSGILIEHDGWTLHWVQREWIMSLQTVGAHAIQANQARYSCPQVLTKLRGDPKLLLPYLNLNFVVDLAFQDAPWYRFIQ